ncbi:MAG: site-2 protease family protein [Bacillota bacterium]
MLKNMAKGNLPMRVMVIRGTEIYFNHLFLLLLIAYGFLGVLPQGLIIFGSVLIHEIAHVLAGGRFGVRFSRIELLPFGGVARTEDFLEGNPEAEARVALAGPLSNLLLIILGVLWHAYGTSHHQLIHFFIQCNAVIGAFNLLPGLPLDGGRVQRAYWATRVGFQEATRRAIQAGKYTSAGLAVLGVISYAGKITDLNPLVMALFLYFASLREEQTARYVFLRYLNRKKGELKQKGVMSSREIVATPSVLIREITASFAPRRYHLIKVVDSQGEIIRTITEQQLIAALFEYGPNLPLSRIP